MSDRPETLNLRKRVTNQHTGPVFPSMVFDYDAGRCWPMALDDLVQAEALWKHTYTRFRRIMGDGHPDTPKFINAFLTRARSLPRSARTSCPPNYSIRETWSSKRRRGYYSSAYSLRNQSNQGNLRKKAQHAAGAK